MCRAERTEQDRVAQPVDDAVSSPGAYLALGLLYTVAALPAIVAPQAVSMRRMPGSVCHCPHIYILACIQWSNPHVHTVEVAAARPAT